MPTYLLIHPFLAGGAILLMYAAFFMKTGGRKYRYAHYVAGLTALTLLIIAVTLGFINTGRYFDEGGTFPWSLGPHLILGLIVTTALTAQAVLGILMWRRPRYITRLKVWHWRIGWGLLLAINIQAALGLWTLVQTMVVSVVTAVSGIIFLMLATGAILMVRRNRQAFQVKITGTEANNVISLDENANGEALQVAYTPDNITVQTTPTRTLLQTSLQAGIQHTHICGGNARCSTCRVLVTNGLENLEQRTNAELTLAERLSLGPEIRLACQTRPHGNVQVRRLVLDDIDAQLASQLNADNVPGPVGEEKTLAILFADIRGFTTFSESQLPYDVVHALNRYYNAVSSAITDNGGEINNYMGDGIMVLFGMAENSNPSLDAIRAGLGMLHALDNLKPYLRQHYSYDFDIGIGIHHGNVVIGNIGAPGNKRVTAIGDAVNLASRIESKTKEANARLLISADTYAVVKAKVETGKEVQTHIKGKTGSYTLYEVTDLHA